MYLSLFESGEEVAPEAVSSDPSSLYRAFEQVADGRKKKGKRYPWPLLLTLLLLGKLAGETSVNGIVDWIKERQGWLRAQLNWPKRFPTNSTYSEALARCDGQQIASMIASVVLKARAMEQGGSEASRLQASQQEEVLTHVARGGKTLRGTLGHQSEQQPWVPSRIARAAWSWRSEPSRTKRMRSVQQRPCFIRRWSKDASSVPMPCIRRSSGAPVCMPMEAMI